MTQLTVRTVLAAGASTLLLVLATSRADAADAARPRCDDDNGGLALPEGFCAFVAADGLGRARDVTVAPNGDVYVAIDGGEGGIAALRDADADGRLEQVERFGGEGGSGVQYQDDHLYFASGLFILRYPLIGGALVPRGVPEIIVTGLLPERARRFEVDGDGNLYVDNAPSDACLTQDRAADAPAQDPCVQAGVWQFSADTPNQDAATHGKRYSTGSRDGIVNAWNTGNGKRYAVMHGVARTSEPWPGDYSDMLIYTGKLFPAQYRGGAFVASAGSGNGLPSERRGHRVDFVRFADGKPAGTPEIFADSFVPADVLRTPGDARDRPVSLAQGPDGSLYIADAEYGRIWRVLNGR